MSAIATNLPAEITAGWLCKHGACEEGLAAFREAFGESTEITRGAAMRAAEHAAQRPGIYHLDFVWLTDVLAGRDASSAVHAAGDAAFASYLYAGSACRWRLGWLDDPDVRAAWRAFMFAEAEALCDVLGLP